MARRTLRTLPPSIDLGDVSGPALLGLWRAAESYRSGYCRPGFQQPVPFRAYAWPRVHGECLMAIRRRAYREATHEELRPHQESEDNLERQAELEQLRGLLARARRSLSSQQRRLMAMCYGDAGVPIGEAGLRMGVSQSRASQIHTAALERMREWLGRHGIRRVEDCI